MVHMPRGCHTRSQHNPACSAVPSCSFEFENKNKEKDFMELCLPKAAACRVVVTSTGGHAEDEPGQPHLPKIMKKKITFPHQRCPEGFCSNFSGAEMKLKIQFKSQQRSQCYPVPFYIHLWVSRGRLHPVLTLQLWMERSLN